MEALLKSAHAIHSRIPKRTFYGHLQHASRRPGGQLKRYRDSLKTTLNQYGIPASDRLESLARDRTTYSAPYVATRYSV